MKNNCRSKPWPQHSNNKDATVNFHSVNHIAGVKPDFILHLQLALHYKSY